MYAPAPEVPQEEVDWPDMLEPFVSYKFQELVKLRKSAVTGLTTSCDGGLEREFVEPGHCERMMQSRTSMSISAFLGTGRALHANIIIIITI